jgi:hydroxypyruvate reductase
MTNRKVQVARQSNHLLTRDAIAIWLAGVNAVRSDTVVAEQIHWDGRWLTIADQVFDLKCSDQLVIVGAGKATEGMLFGLLTALQASRKSLPKITGWINVPQGVDPPTNRLGHALDQHPLLDQMHGVTVCYARPPGCNEPTQTAVDGTRQILNHVQQAGRNDCVLALISGGGSALLCSPIDGLALDEKVQLTRALSSSGANIEQLNSVRRCLSNVKGGGLARSCKSNKLITCIISDVLGDPLDLIASGPTILKPAPDPAQAIAVLEKLLPDRFPRIESILNKLMNRSLSIRGQENPKIELTTIVLANNATAVDAAGQKAVELGYRYWMKSERQSEGEARLLGQHFAQQMHSTLEQSQIDCIISGGEPTVVLPPAVSRGLGGRNQQLALAFLNWFELQGGWPLHADLAFVSGGTDGEDGPTNAAGAFVDQEVYSRTMALGLSSDDYLERCDANRFFDATDGLLMTGPTRTNVCDLRVGLVRASILEN